MKFFMTLLKYLIILLRGRILAAALTARSWYKGWPIFTGAAAVAGVTSLYLAFRGAAALWRWKDKRRFVSKIMSESRETAPEHADSAVRSAWNAGMSCIKQSPSRFSRRFAASQPWFIALEDKTSESSPFEQFGRRIPDGPSPLYWHFLPSCVLLRLSASEEAGRVWESELEEIVASSRASAPIGGVVLKMEFSAVDGMGTAELDAFGQRLRTRLSQIMLAANAVYPVYILVEGIESILGMEALLTQFAGGAEGLPLGGWDGGFAAAWLAAERLEDFILDGAVGGTPPHGDMLAALSRLKGLAPKLGTLSENISRDLAHQAAPDFAGVFFCASRPASGNSHRPAFAGEFLSRVLPASPRPRPFSGIPVSAGGKIAVMAGWLLLTLSFCGLLAANTIYQYRILSEDPHVAAARGGAHENLMVLDPSQGGLSADYSQLYAEMNYILKLENAHSSWFLPKMGEDMLGRALLGVKRDYVRDVNRLILRPMAEQFREILASPATDETRGRDMDMAIELTWLTSALSDRLKRPQSGFAGLHSDAGAFPLTGLNADDWTPVTGQLIMNALRWIDSKEQLSAVSMEMQSLLVQSFTRKGSNLLKDLTAHMNASHGTEAVRLSQFWPHIAMQSAEDAYVDFCYTSAGRKALHDAIEDIRGLAGDSSVLGVYLDNFTSEYFVSYAKAWENFARSFASAGPSLRAGNLFQYPAYEKIAAAADLPHVKACRRIMAEAAPLLDSGAAPRWAARMQLVDAVVAMALSNSDGSDKTRLENMFSAVESNPELLTQIRSGVRSDARVSDLVKAESAMRSFFENCGALLGSVSVPSSALSLCAAKYGQDKGTEHPEAAPYDAAAASFAEAFALLDDEWSPAREVLSGILDFIAAEATIEAAKVLQSRWEDEVLNSPTILYGRGGGEAAFSAQGAVPAFVQNNLGGLLSHRSGVPVPSDWDGSPFPFDGAFLKALAQGAGAASSPPPPERKESYKVHISSRPPIVNIGAALRPSVMTLTLEGEDGTQQLLNQNFPRDADFTYSPGKSGRAALVISFPGFDLRREYGGLKELVTEFRMGEKTFFPMDFPGLSEQMDSAGVKTIKVPLVISNTAGIFDDPKKKAPKFPELPLNITKVVVR